MPNVKVSGLFVGLLLLLVFAQPGAAAGSSLEAAKAAAEEMYTLYAAGEFGSVYDRMVPEIQALFSREQYVDYQERHTNRFRFTITAVQVLTVEPAASLPGSLGRLVDPAVYDELVRAAVSYEAAFVAAGLRHQDIVHKDVFLVRQSDLGVDPVWLFLWDPEPLQEEF